MEASLDDAVPARRGSPRVQVPAPGPILGRTASGALLLLIPLPVDYVAWTERVARRGEQADLNVPDRGLSISGRVSPRAQKELAARTWKLYEAFSISAER